MKFGYHPLCDLYNPDRVLNETVLAEKFGFKHVFFPDHFHPWTLSEGSSFAWTIIASAAERTEDLKLGTAVTSPIQRYHPAIVAQAFSTLAATYEGRIFLGVGSGERLNEVPLGLEPPKPSIRTQMMEEAVQVIKRLWSEEYVNFSGRFYSLKNARLFTKPKEKIPLYISAFGPKAAEIAGRLGDGLITGNLPEDYLKNTLLQAFETGTKRRTDEASEEVKKIAELIVSYDKDYDKAVEACRPFAAVLSPLAAQTTSADPRELKEIADSADSKTIAEAMLATTDIERIIRALEKFEKLGFDIVEIASLASDCEGFLKLFRDSVAPHFAKDQSN